MVRSYHYSTNVLERYVPSPMHPLFCPIKKSNIGYDAYPCGTLVPAQYGRTCLVRRTPLVRSIPGGYALHTILVRSYLYGTAVPSWYGVPLWYGPYPAGTFHTQISQNFGPNFWGGVRSVPKLFKPAVRIVPQQRYVPYRRRGTDRDTVPGTGVPGWYGRTPT